MTLNPRSALAACSQKAAPVECFEELSCALCVNSECEVYVSVCTSVPEVFLTPLCVVCQWLIQCWMGVRWTLTRSHAKNSILVCWVRTSTEIGFLKGKVDFPYHWQSRRSHQWYFNCIPSSCLHILLSNMSKFVPKWFQCIFLFSYGTEYLKEGCVAQTFIRVRSLTAWNWYNDSNLLWHQKLNFLKWCSPFFHTFGGNIKTVRGINHCCGTVEKILSTLDYFCFDYIV